MIKRKVDTKMKKIKYEYVRNYLKGIAVGFGLMIPYSILVWHMHHLFTVVSLTGLTLVAIVVLDDLKEDYDRKAGK